MSLDFRENLRRLVPQHEFLIGVDSDGAALDTMDLKQKECFLPQTIRVFGLEAVPEYARETALFVALYSRSRGVNRFPALLRILELLRQRPEVEARGVRIPDTSSLREWVTHETHLGNPALKARVEKTGDPLLAKVLEWSEAADAAVEAMCHGVKPFASARPCLEKARARADLIVVSQSPIETLKREWSDHQMDHLARCICAQEHGTKSQHLDMAMRGKYCSDHVLMIGDAYGDLQAARDNAVLFFPIRPGQEEDSWRDLTEEGLERFFGGSFAGEYQQRLLDVFESLLPVEPSW
jgi:phosphoglycolate phosphatase-like HAD superfamily hydrolase